MSLSEDLRPGPHAAPRVPRLPAALVERPRLYARLDVGAPLTVVHAPGGFGKTTLVASWLERRTDDSRVVWVSVAADVAGPEGFWASFARELTRAGIGVRQGPASARSVQEALGSAPGPTLVVVDGLDHVAGVEADLLEAVRASRDVRMIVCLRRSVTMIDWGLIDLDAVDVAPTDLLFTEAESTWLLRALVPGASTESCAEAHAQLGGWPAFVRAAAANDLDLDRTFAMLRGQVPAALADPAMVRFVEQTAILDEVSAEVALVVTQDAGAEEKMARLIEAGLLQPADRSGVPSRAVRRARSARPVRRHTYLPVVRRALAGLLRETSVHAVRTGHERLARWYEAQGEHVEAVVHAVEAHAWDLLVELLDAGWNTIVTSRRVAEHLRAVPDAEAASRPDLAALRSALLHAHLRQYAATPAMPTGTDRRPDANPTDDPDLRSVLTEHASPSIFLRVNGHGAASVDLVQEMEDAYARASRADRADVAQYLPSVGLHWALCWLMHDDLTRAASSFTTTFALASAHTVPFSMRNCAGGLGLVFALAGDPARASHWLEKEQAAPVDESPFATMASTVGRAARAILALDALDLDAAEGVLVETVDPSERDEMWPFVAYAHAELALLRGNPHAGLQLLSAARVAHAAQASGRAAECLLGAAAANLLLAHGQASQAAVMLQRLPPRHALLRAPRARVALLGGDASRALRELTGGRLEDHAHGRGAAEVSLLTAHSLLRLDRTREAAEEFERGLGIVAQTGIVRPLGLLARADLAALVDLAGAGEHLLADPRLPAREVFPATGSIVSLTERERLVLEHLDQGLAPAQIAAQLVLSPNTIKSQVRSVYRKLGASSRDEALLIARRSGLLSSEP